MSQLFNQNRQYFRQLMRLRAQQKSSSLSKIIQYLIDKTANPEDNRFAKENPTMICIKSKASVTDHSQMMKAKTLQNSIDQTQFRRQLYSLHEKSKHNQTKRQICQNLLTEANYRGKYSNRKFKKIQLKDKQKGKYIKIQSQKQPTPVLLIKQLPISGLYATKDTHNQCPNEQPPQISINLNYRPQSNSNYKKQCLPFPTKSQAFQYLITEPKDYKQKMITFSGNHSPIRKTKNRANKNIINRGSNITESNKNKIAQKRLLTINYTKPFIPPPNITAKSYIIYKFNDQSNSSAVIGSYNCKNRQQIASLTKIMTAILILDLCKTLQIDKYAQEITVSSYQAGVTGTTAFLKEGQIYTVHQLLYGLMLPSGNDASIALAIWAGNKLNERCPQPLTIRSKYTQRPKSCLKFNDSMIRKIEQNDIKLENYRRFIKEMNAKAQNLRMKKTYYANAHGLPNPQNKSCAYDIALLCEYCMKNETFRDIVSSQKYSGIIKMSPSQVNKVPTADNIYASPYASFQSASIVGKKYQYFQKYDQSRYEPDNSQNIIKIQWQNTHELVKKNPQEYVGIKTGFTYTAGPCLASCLKIDNIEYIIVVLGCESLSMRFRDTQSLKKWLKKQQQTNNSTINWQQSLNVKSISTKHRGRQFSGGR